MAEAARRLEGIIAAVEAERTHADIERRHVLAKSRNAKAQRLVARLEECDQSLASLLTDAAGCLATFVTKDGPSSRVDTQATTRGSDSTSEDEDAENRLHEFETRAQDWFATLNDVQLGLRSAVRNLRKAQRVPIARDAGSRGSSSTSMSTNADAKLGSATKGHTLPLVLSESSRTQHERQGPSRATRDVGSADVDRPGQSTREIWQEHKLAMQNGTLENDAALLGIFVDNGSTPSLSRQVRDEATLSLSALRLQHDSWMQLEEALRVLALERRAIRGKRDLTDAELKALLGTYSGGDLDRVRSRQAHTTAGMTPSEVQRQTREVVDRRISRDSRLIDAVLHLNMEFLPELSVSPLRGPAAPEPIS